MRKWFSWRWYCFDGNQKMEVGSLGHFVSHWLSGELESLHVNRLPFWVHVSWHISRNAQYPLSGDLSWQWLWAVAPSAWRFLLCTELKTMLLACVLAKSIVRNSLLAATDLGNDCGRRRLRPEGFSSLRSWRRRRWSTAGPLRNCRALEKLSGLFTKDLQSNDFWSTHTNMKRICCKRSWMIMFKIEKGNKIFQKYKQSNISNFVSQ